MFMDAFVTISATPEDPRRYLEKFADTISFPSTTATLHLSQSWNRGSDWPGHWVDIIQSYTYWDKAFSKIVFPDGSYLASNSGKEYGIYSNTSGPYTVYDSNGNTRSGTGDEILRHSYSHAIRFKTPVSGGILIEHIGVLNNASAHWHDFELWYQEGNQNAVIRQCSLGAITTNIQVNIIS